MERRKGDQISVELFRPRRGNGQDGMSDLLDVDGLGERCFLRIVAFEVDTGLGIDNRVRGRWGMMAVTMLLRRRKHSTGTRADTPNLLARQLRRPGSIPPLAKEELPQEGVQRLLLVAVLLAPTGVLLLQGGQEPLEDKECPLGRIGLFCGGREDGWVLAPVRAKFGQAGGGEDERRRREAGQITVEGCDGLRNSMVNDLNSRALGRSAE
jgi:hypothetical protein